MILDLHHRVRVAEGSGELSHSGVDIGEQQRTPAQATAFAETSPFDGQALTRTARRRKIDLLWWGFGAATFLLGISLRLVTLRQYTGHIDEPSSLLAIQRVAERGYPLFPSGVLYLQGAVLSYLAAPLTWFFEDASLLDAVRVLQVLLSSLAIPLVVKLVFDISASRVTALLAGFLVACDPGLIIWGVAIRPYGLLAVEVLALMLLFHRLVVDGMDARVIGVRAIWLLPVLATLGTFTQIGFWVTIPSLALAALLIWRGRLLTTHRPVLLSATAALIPLASFVVLGRYVGTGNGTGGGEVGGSFMGSHIFDFPNPLRMEEYEWTLWTSLFLQGGLHQFMPYLLVLVTGILLAWLLSPPQQGRPGSTPIIASMLLVHWASIGLVILLSAPSAGTRYLLHVLPLGYALLSLAALVLWRLAAAHERSTRVLVRAGMAAIMVAPALIYAVTAAQWRIDFPGGNPAYWEATAWVAKQSEPGEAVLTAMPPPAYFWLDGEEQPLYFLAGPEGSERAAQYTKQNADGELVDYWLGITPIVSQSSLCAAFRQHAGTAWVIVDHARLDDPDMLGPQMKQIITGATEVRHRGANGVLVLQVSPPSEWAPEATAACDRSS